MLFSLFISPLFPKLFFEGYVKECLFHQLPHSVYTTGFKCDLHDVSVEKRTHPLLLGLENFEFSLSKCTF